MKAKLSQTSDREDPFSIEDLLGVTYELPEAEPPHEVRSFAGWGGIMIDPSAVGENPRVGFQRLETSRELGAWIMTATHPYSFGLPLLKKTVIPRPKRKAAPKRRTEIPEPVHHAWNARHYHPTISPFTEKVGKSATGKRAIPLAPIDALFFGDDNRAPYFPTPYPWTCVGRLETANGQSMGAGALVGRNLVLTARHVILEKPTTAIKFVPGYYNGQSSSGASVFSWAKSASYYEGSDYGAWDFALVSLYQPLGDSLGFFGVRTYQDRWDDWNVWATAGYPTMSPYNSQVPSYLLGVSIDDADSDGDALELESENQDTSKGNSGGPLWAVWPKGPYIVGVTSAILRIDFGPFGTDYGVLNAGGKAMVDFVSLARLQIDTTIHINPPKINLGP